MKTGKPRRTIRVTFYTPGKPCFFEGTCVRETTTHFQVKPFDSNVDEKHAEFFAKNAKLCHAHPISGC